jgi:hypothetical protein
MFTKNVFTQTDAVADLIKDINEADYKAKMEALKGNQHKIDKNKNNKVDADDFKILRGEKKVNEEEQVEEGWDDMLKAVKAKAGPQPSGGSGMKQGSRYGGSKQKDKPEHDDEKVKKEEIDPKKVTTDTLAGQVKGKTSNPFAPKKVMMDVPGDVKEEAEQVDERELSKGETAEKERIVKGMKKGLAGFKARYGDRAKSVMYATATKAAKKDYAMSKAGILV